jgi:hypothetical protein
MGRATPCKHGRRHQTLAIGQLFRRLEHPSSEGRSGIVAEDHYPTTPLLLQAWTARRTPNSGLMARRWQRGGGGSPASERRTERSQGARPLKMRVRGRGCGTERRVAISIKTTREPMLGPPPSPRWTRNNATVLMARGFRTVPSQPDPPQQPQRPCESHNTKRGKTAPKGGYLGAALHTGLEALGETPNPGG